MGLQSLDFAGMSLYEAGVCLYRYCRGHVLTFNTAGLRMHQEPFRLLCASDAVY
jgi:hypothetical protein